MNWLHIGFVIWQRTVILAQGCWPRANTMVQGRITKPIHNHVINHIIVFITSYIYSEENNGSCGNQYKHKKPNNVKSEERKAQHSCGRLSILTSAIIYHTSCTTHFHDSCRLILKRVCNITQTFVLFLFPKDSFANSWLVKKEWL